MTTENTSGEPGERTRITLTGPQETLMATLYGRYLDASSPNPVVNDKWAAEVVGKIDYDFAKIGMDTDASTSVAGRGRLLDRWTAEFLENNPSATVLHFACGLDSRCLRVDRGPRVRWIDIDLPDVVTLRQKLYPIPSGDYTLLAEFAAQPDGWISKIPADRPTIAVLEGLTMYLKEDEVRLLFQSIVDHFSTIGGQLIFDAYGTFGITLQTFVKPVRRTGSTLHWGLDNGKTLLEWCPKLKILDEHRSIQMPGSEDWPTALRWKFWILSWIPYMKDVGRMMRYQF
jgi:O-methyltransferase involved in polyketide biosynthesis